MSFRNFNRGFLFGTIIGGTLGLLLAPTSGKKMRENIKKEFIDTKNTAVNFDTSIKNFQAALLQLKNTVEEILPPVIEDSQKMMESFQFQMEPRLKQLNKHIDKLIKDLPEAKS